MEKRNYDMQKIETVLELLKNGEKLPRIYKDHQLKGNLKEFRELHITSDWLLIYKKNDKEIILTLTRTGTHSDLLDM